MATDTHTQSLHSNATGDTLCLPYLLNKRRTHLYSSTAKCIPYNSILENNKLDLLDDEQTNPQYFPPDNIFGLGDYKLEINIKMILMEAH
jgi:hypothetical protein